MTDAEIECASPVTYAPRGTSTMVSCRYTLAGVAHVRARPGVHLAAQHIQVGFRPDLGVRWLLCSRAPSGAHLAELATLLLAGGDAVGSDIILTRIHVWFFVFLAMLGVRTMVIQLLKLAAVISSPVSYCELSSSSSDSLSDSSSNSAEHLQVARVRAGQCGVGAWRRRHD